MNNPNLIPTRRSLWLTLTLTLASAGLASAALVNYTNNDALNTSSFIGGMGATNWDSGQPPTFGNDYVVATNRTLRTPTNGLPALAYTFAGSSLTLGAGTGSAGTLSMKCSNVVTVANLILTNGTVANGDPGGTPKITRIAGNINIQTNGFFKPTDINRTLVVTATLSGSGNLLVNDRGLVTLSGAHTFNGPLTITGTILDMDGTVSITPSSLIVGKDSIAASGTNFNSCTNIVRAGGSLNVGYGPAGDLRVGWRTTSQITNNPTGVLDVSAQSQFNANVGNFIIGYSQAASSATAASALGLVYLATNNNIIATNIVIGNTTEGTHPSQQQLWLGRGSNYIDTPILVVGAAKQRALLTLPAGGTLVLTNSATGRTDLTVGGNNAGTSANPTDLMDLSGGPFIASLGNLILGQKSGALSGGAQATLTLATNSANKVDVNDVTLGSMAGNDAGTTSASGTLNLNGGSFQVNNNLTLGSYDNSGFGTANGTINLNAGSLSVAGDILDGGGGSTLNFNGGLTDLLPAGDVTPGNVTVDILVLNGTMTNAGSITVSNLSGSGASLSQSGVAIISGNLNPGTATTVGTLKLGGLILSSTATLRMNLTNTTTVGSGVNDLLDITGDVDLGNATLSVGQLASGLAAGTYRLANYTGDLINSLTLPNVGRYTLSLTTDTGTSPKHLNLVVSGNPFALLWGGELGSAWDINTTQNWTNQLSNADYFFDNDTVLFNDASPNPNVTLDVTVQPGNVIFSNNASVYDLTGTGTITGSGGLTKSGTGSTTVSTTNDFTGPVAINAGLLIAGNGGALGATNSGTTIASGATFDLNDKSFSGELFHVSGIGYDGNGALVNNDTVNPLGARTATRNVVLDGDTTFGGFGRWDIRGNGFAESGSLFGPNYLLTKVGSAGVYFTDGTAVNISNLVVNLGSVVIESASTINSNALITVNSGATLSFYRLSTPMGRNVILNDGIIKSSDASVSSQNQVSGGLTLNGVCIAETTGNSTNILHLNGKVTGPGQLVKMGGFKVELLNSANDWTGGTTISNGTLSVGDGIVNGSLPATPAVITNYATLMFNVAPNTTNTPAQEITGPGNFIKRGDGILALTVSNSFTGNVSTGDGSPLSGGVIRFLNSAAFGDPSISKTVSVIRCEIQLAGFPIPPSIYFQTSAQTNITGAGSNLVAFRSISGINTISNTVEVFGGAGSCEYSSDAGLLQFDGPIFLGNISSRSAIFSGAGDGVVNGQLSNQPTNALTVEKRGSGTWTLTAANLYTGPTIVSAGKLVIQGSIGGGTVTVQTNAILAGTGTINAPVIVQPGGKLAPGTSVGSLTINSNLTLQGTALMEIGRNGSVLTSDLVTGIITNTYGGTLIVTNVGSSALQAGDTFKLFTAATYVGAFTSIVYPAGYNWTNNLAVDGTIGVASVITGSPTLGYTVSGNNLTFTWTGSYKLQAQTNALSIGLRNNWADVPGGNISGVSIPINPANGTVFFRLAQ